MAMLILNRQKAFKVPECPSCSSYMLPKDLEMESGQWKCPPGQWKCPHCMGEVSVNKDKVDE